LCAVAFTQEFFISFQSIKFVNSQRNCTKKSFAKKTTHNLAPALKIPIHHITFIKIFSVTVLTQAPIVNLLLVIFGDFFNSE